MPTHLLYVPTNRSCVDQVDQLVAEAQLLTAADTSCALAVIEHGDAPWVERHRDALARRARGVGAFHLTTAATSRFLRAVVEELGLARSTADRLLSLLHPNEVAYGAGPNKAALLAAALGCDVLHRRDSDVRVDHGQAGPAYPCVAELGALGRTPHELGLDRQAAAAERVEFVGTSCFGSPPQDRRDLLAAGERFLVELELLAAPDDSPERLKEELRQYLTVDPATRYTEDFYELDPHGRTVMSACALARVFRELPEMPLAGTLGTDYLRRNLLRALGRPLVFHSRKMRHRYDEDRARQTDPAAVNDYAHRDLRHLILWPILVRHHDTLRRSPELFLTAAGGLDVASYADSVAVARDHVAPAVADLPFRFGAIYRAAAGVVGDRVIAARLHGVADSVESGPDFVQEVLDGVEDFCLLLRHWPDLVDAATRGAACLDELRV